jgi:hypothetical protein
MWAFVVAMLEPLLDDADLSVSDDLRSCLIGGMAFGSFGMLRLFSSGCKFYSNHS